MFMRQASRAGILIAGLTGLACSSHSSLKAGKVGDGGAEDGQASGGVAGGSAGAMGAGGMMGTGGATGGDASAGVVCSDDTGSGFSAFARQCAQDSDCTIRIAQNCCGASDALGIAKAQVAAYGNCFGLPPGGCGQLGCASFTGFVTDTGKTTPWLGSATQPIDFVSVNCLGHLCTTDVVLPPDAGQDVSSGLDQAVDTGGQSCGKATCTSDQVCVLVSGGPAPLCHAPGDGGCPPDWVYTTSCYDPSMGAQVSPGCSEPSLSPAPHCVDVPAACSDLCSCICHVGGGVGCVVTPAYLFCGYP
jgi:hypothetical protein